jgi:hypothetical protein
MMFPKEEGVEDEALGRGQRGPQGKSAHFGCEARDFVECVFGGPRRRGVPTAWNFRPVARAATGTFLTRE